jgi:hypothetical protein
MYCSADEQHCVQVIPKSIISPLRYFEDLSNGKDNPGVNPGQARSAQAAVFRKSQSGKYDHVRSFALLNDVSPVNVLVAGDGRFVTFDNWHSAGYGDDVVVIYENDGTVVKKYSLEELLTAKKVESLPHTVSSIWWGGEHKLDEARGQVALKIVKDAEHEDTFTDLRLDLATGAIAK